MEKRYISRKQYSLRDFLNTEKYMLNIIDTDNRHYLVRKYLIDIIFRLLLRFPVLQIRQKNQRTPHHNVFY